MKIKITSDQMSRYKKGEIVSGATRKADGNFLVKGSRDKMLNGMGFNTTILSTQCKIVK